MYKYVEVHENSMAVTVSRVGIRLHWLREPRLAVLLYYLGGRRSQR